MKLVIVFPHLHICSLPDCAEDKSKSNCSSCQKLLAKKLTASLFSFSDNHSNSLSTHWRTLSADGVGNWNPSSFMMRICHLSADVQVLCKGMKLDTDLVSCYSIAFWCMSINILLALYIHVHLITYPLFLSHFHWSRCSWLFLVWGWVFSVKSWVSAGGCWFKATPTRPVTRIFRRGLHWCLIKFVVCISMQD